MLAPLDIHVKEESVETERWSWDDPWLPKIQSHSGCNYAEIMEKLQDEFFGSEPSSTPIQAKDAGPAHSTGDTTVPLPPPTFFEQTNQLDDSSRFVANWDYTSDQMHVDSQSAGMFSPASVPMRTGFRSQHMPSLPAGPSLFIDVSQSSPSIDPRLLNGNVSQSQNCC
jgi:hypothetical protein